MTQGFASLLVIALLHTLFPTLPRVSFELVSLVHLQIPYTMTVSHFRTCTLSDTVTLDLCLYT
jgi:hypothetical protein